VTRFEVPDSGVLSVVAWVDPVVDLIGHDPRSDYVERFWLGVLGPSTTLLLRYLARCLDEEPGGLELDAHEVARRLGVGHKGGRSSPFLRSLGRCIGFGLARDLGRGTLAVRRKLPPLNRRQLAHLTPSLQAAHRAWAPSSRGPGQPGSRGRARQLALSLLEIGEGAGEAESQLRRWGFESGEAREAVAWALQRRAGAAVALGRASPEGA
jgi:hypothetical protein